MNSSTEPKSHLDRVLIIHFVSTWINRLSVDVKPDHGQRFIPNLHPKEYELCFKSFVICLKMSHCQIIIVFPYLKDAVVLFVPEEKIPPGLYIEMCSSLEFPQALIHLSGIVRPDHIIGDGFATMPDIKVNKIFTFIA